MENKIIEDKPIIILDLRPNLMNFMINQFGEDEKGMIKLNKRNPIGVFIDSMWSVSALPIKHNYENPVKLILPINNENHYIVKYNFIHFESWKMNQINDYIEARMDLYIREFFQTGYEKKYCQKTIIEALLINLNIKKNQYSFDMLKQYDFRNRRNTIRKVTEDIQQAIIQ